MVFKYQSASVLKNQSPLKRENSRLHPVGNAVANQNISLRRRHTTAETQRRSEGGSFIKSIFSLSHMSRFFDAIHAFIRLSSSRILSFGVIVLALPVTLFAKREKTSRFSVNKDREWAADSERVSSKSHDRDLSFANEFPPQKNKAVCHRSGSVSDMSLIQRVSERSSDTEKGNTKCILNRKSFFYVPPAINFGGYFKTCSNTLGQLSGGGLHAFSAVLFVLFSSVLWVCTFMRRAAVLLLSLVSSVLSVSFLSVYMSLSAICRFVFVMLARWMKIHGSHAAVSVRIRRLRMLTVTIVMVIMSAGVVARLYALQGIQHSKWNKIAFKQHGAGVQVEGARGLILDRNGMKLAVSVPALTLGVHPKWIKNPEEVTAKLSPVLEIPQKDILEKLKEDKQFTILARGVSIAKKKDIESMKIFGLELEEEFNRVYPQGDLASTIIGKAGKDGIGLSGVERSLNPSLIAPSLRLVANRDARGRLMSSAVWSEDEEHSSILDKIKYQDVSSVHRGDELRKEGANVTLTIDSMVQRIVEEEFDKSKESAKAKNVFGLMMDAKTGEIIAIGQTTRYNPNENKNISTEALRNVVLQNSFEPGSTFKPIVAAVALDRGLTSKDEMINCENGKYPIGKRLIRDAHPIPTVTFEQVIVRSSNIGMAKLGFRLGKDQLYSSLYDFGFGKKTGIELSGESSGIMRHSNNWAQIDIATHSFGQGVSVTALQMARAYAALANGGLLVTPSIIKSAQKEETPVRLISQKTADIIKQALYLVTEDEHGTGKNSRISGVPVYGKTGTAQKARENGRGYDPDKILASFIGFVDGAPVGVDRTLVLYVAVDEPGVTPRWGGTLAAPVFKSVMERTLSYLLSQRSLSENAQFVSAQKNTKHM